MRKPTACIRTVSVLSVIACCVGMLGVLIRIAANPGNVTNGDIRWL